MSPPTAPHGTPTHDLAPEDVRRLAAAIGLAIADEDLVDVTVRLNATLEHLTALDRLEPETAPPPASLEPEGR